jgi:hypothetical protein
LGTGRRSSVVSSMDSFSGENPPEKFSYNPRTGEMLISSYGEIHARTIGKAEKKFDDFVRGIVFYKNSYQELPDGKIEITKSPEKICLRVFSFDREDNFNAQYDTEATMREKYDIPEDTEFEYDMTNDSLTAYSMASGGGKSRW